MLVSAYRQIGAPLELPRLAPAAVSKAQDTAQMAHQQAVDVERAIRCSGLRVEFNQRRVGNFCWFSCGGAQPQSQTIEASAEAVQRRAQQAAQRRAQGAQPGPGVGVGSVASQHDGVLAHRFEGRAFSEVHGCCLSCKRWSSRRSSRSLRWRCAPLDGPCAPANRNWLGRTNGLRRVAGRCGAASSSWRLL